MKQSTQAKNFLIKFEQESDRVKGLAFHPKRPWLLASLHDGTIQLWDYRMEVLLDTFKEHDGPVRGVDFHKSQPLFVSGGDDNKVKVWNYQTKRCLFNLFEHIDYIRTVQFHDTHPWILSASDDQTIRIWNWQSRKCLAILTGHNHYVMCAQFHPKNDLVLSASLDHDVRIWDVSRLTNKTANHIGSDYGSVPIGGQNAGGGGDMFGGQEHTLAHVLEGHTRGVNWASFHPKLNLVVSGADDREVKLWRYNDAKAWEVESMRGHQGNVSSVLFHPKQNMIISNSEDRSVCVFDMSKTKQPIFYTREEDRFWILAAHNSLNLLAAGHDSGFLIFKLNRERPALCSQPKQDKVYYMKAPYVMEYSFQTKTSKPIVSTGNQTGSASGSSHLGLGGSGTSVPPRSLSYNYANRSMHCVLITSDQENSYELLTFPKAGGRRSTDSDGGQQSYRGFGRCAVFVSSTRFAVLDKARQVWLKNLRNEFKEKIKVPNLVVSAIFYGGVGRLLLRTADSMVSYDIQSLKVISELKTQARHPIKYAEWSHKNKYVALFSRSKLYIADAKLKEQCAITEDTRIKSGGWDKSGVFVYTTSTHIKYLLPNGDRGVIRTLDTPIYVTNVQGGKLYFIDREHNCGHIAIDCTEYLFKVALMKKRHKKVLKIMQSKKLVGQSIISYLQRKGYPEVALHFVTDPAVKFDLALECGNIQVALNCAADLDKKECWYRLGVEALRQGNHQVVEAAYQKTKNFERLSFLYLITGNTANLQKMLQIAKMRGDTMGRFHNSLYLGNVEERVRVLEESGQLRLALLTAAAHNLEAEVQRLGQKLPGETEEEKQGELDLVLEQLQEFDGSEENRLLLPPAPILRANNWPLLEVGKGFFDQLDDAEPVSSEDEKEELDLDDESGDEGSDAALEDMDSGWAADLIGDGEGDGEEDGADGMDDWGDLGIDLGDDADDAEEEEEEEAGGFVMPSFGKTVQEKWDSSSLVYDLVAAGSFDMAMHLLKRQTGITNFKPLKDNCIKIVQATQGAVAFTPGSAFLHTLPLLRTEGKSGLPSLVVKLTDAEDELKKGLKLVTQGKFSTALGCFNNIFQLLPLLVVNSSLQTDVLTLLSYAREYVTAIRLELARRESKEPVRQAELAAYFANCEIQPLHQLLGLRSAIKYAYGVKCNKTTAGFCRRVLELSTNYAAFKTKQIKGVLKLCEKNETDAKELNYDASKAFDVCCKTFEPLYHGEAPSVKCPYCASVYKKEFAGEVCATCQMGKIGAQSTGLKCWKD